tara:strand:+ start:1620 stop:1847 length:228 start_codon:yes stop_codon:yes gene_type:complete
LWCRIFVVDACCECDAFGAVFDLVRLYARAHEAQQQAEYVFVYGHEREPEHVVLVSVYVYTMIPDGGVFSGVFAL